MVSGPSHQVHVKPTLPSLLLILTLTLGSEHRPWHLFLVVSAMKHCALLFPRVWDVNTGEVLNTLIHHNEAVLHLRFSNGLMVTCSKDRSIAVWDMASATDITLRRVLVGHRAAVNVVDFDDKYIVSASGDRTIKVSVPTVRTLFPPLLAHRESRGGLHQLHIWQDLDSPPLVPVRHQGMLILCF